MSTTNCEKGILPEKMSERQTKAGNQEFLAGNQLYEL